MKKKRWNSALILMMIGVLAILAGCQPVANVDISKALANTFAVKSAEGKQSLTVELTADPSAVLSPEDKRIFDLFSKITLDITEYKAKDPLNASMKGTFGYSGGSIPFEMVMTNTYYIIQIEGAKKPLLIRNDASTWNPAGDPIPLSDELQKQLQQLTEKAVDAMPSFGTFFSRNLPNPNTITVEEVNETVNGESLNLQKVHAEIYGKELVGLVKGFLTNVLADEQGLKEFIGTLYDLYVPFVKQMMQEIGTEPNDPTAAAITPYLNNKTLAVEFIHTFIKTNLEQLLADYDQSVEALFASEAGAKAKEWLNGNQVFKMDMYVDEDLMTRKSASELLLTLPQGLEGGLKSIKITSTAETWNINQPVAINQIHTTGGVIELNGNETRVTPSKIVASLDPNSQLYKLLKNDLQVTKKDIQLFINEEVDPFLSIKPFNDQGTVMVPARFVAERLDADVEWDAAARQVKVTDHLNGTVILLTIDSKEATVNGQAKQLEKAAVLVDNVTYIPVRFVSESMGAEVNWDQDSQMVSITRD
ncbi:copper amine oxidase N-terminal domain-containing protein [Paenibacillus naphthalenovorans]|uniref:copper amine oxidase N-terminal domain-containing protein n=1 Tax=Paenibacillus naphthalenovorans TaxID=162209 RepID=UPI0008809EEC|nr:copper amine oxidase N-terminal domain-containing protein [Paenibacillus naphthalenovorans]SDI25309.1 Copper amine oxidase N-terminal domain-containing protein [Paenibacillus naphthalenovorans]